MNKEEFEKRLADTAESYKLTRSEKKYLADIDDTIKQADEQRAEAKRRIAEINNGAYHRFTGRLTDDEEIEAKACKEVIKHTSSAIKSAEAARHSYDDDLRKLVAKRDDIAEKVRIAEQAVITAEIELEKAQSTYDFDTIVEHEKKVLLAKQTLRVTEDAYKDIVYTLNGFVPEREKRTEKLLQDITKDTAESLLGYLDQSITAIHNTLDQASKVRELEEAHDDTGTLTFAYGLRFGWLYSMLQTMETMRDEARAKL